MPRPDLEEIGSFAPLNLVQVGWRKDNGNFCFGHEHHHQYDGIAWCEPVYVLRRANDSPAT